MILTLAGSISASGQGGFITHFDSLQSGRNGRGTSVRAAQEGFCVFATRFSQEFPSRSHVYLIRLDDCGNIIDELHYNYGSNMNHDLGFMDSIYEREDGSFMAAMAYDYSYEGETWLYRFDDNGNVVENTNILQFSAEDSVFHAIRQAKPTMDGGGILCGFYDRPGLTVSAYLVKYDEFGDTLWTSRLGLQDQAFDALGVQEYTDGGFLLTGYRNYGNPWNMSFLIRTDAQGNELWRRFYGGVATQNGAVRIAADGNIITWSAYREPDWEFEWQQMMLTKWSPGGSILWQRKVIKDYQVGTTDMEILEDGSIIAAGTNWNRSVLIKFSAEGDSLWSREHTLFTGYHFLYDVQPTSDGGFVGTGATTGGFFTPGIQTNQVIWVVKTDSMGCVVPGCHTVGVEEYVMDLNEHLRVWPNPVASGAPLTVAFTPPPEFAPNGPLRVVVLDALGRQVHDERVQVGTCQLANLPLAAGSYHLHLTDNTRWLAGKSFVVE